MNRATLKNCRRIVVKVGTSTITHPNGTLNLRRMERIARSLADLRNQGREVILVSSGAVGAGMGRVGLAVKPASLPVRQALAAIGQGLVVGEYEKLFGEYGHTAAQVLVTRDAFGDRSRYLNICYTFRALLELGAVPVVNENDTVAVDEIKFGDNDTLSALVACAAGADLLIILSDIDGLYTADPRLDPSAKLIHQVETICQKIRDGSGSKGSNASSGGMFTKLAAADIVRSAGIPLVIAKGSEDGVLYRILDGEELGTLFLPAPTPERARKGWIAWGDVPHGRVTVDAGAAAALCLKGGSLLPSGVTGVSGDFGAGRVVSVCGPSGEEIARGLVNYDSRNLAKIAGCQTDQIESLLGAKDYDEVMHRDNMLVRPVANGPERGRDE